MNIVQIAEKRIQLLEDKDMNYNKCARGRRRDIRH